MSIVISSAGIDMGGNPVSNASQIDSVVMNENGASVATETQVGTANSALVKTALNATGTAPIYACRAWVNFNGIGTVAIRASGNVSSITDGGVGTYTINFTTAMPDANYCPYGICGGSVSGTYSINPNILNVSYLMIQTRFTNNANTDLDTITVSINR